MLQCSTLENNDFVNSIISELDVNILVCIQKLGLLLRLALHLVDLTFNSLSELDIFSVD
jgi:hypothetical protein